MIQGVGRLTLSREILQLPTWQRWANARSQTFLRYSGTFLSKVFKGRMIKSLNSWEESPCLGLSPKATCKVQAKCHGGQRMRHESARARAQTVSP